MNITLAELEALIQDEEGERLEFKAAKNHFDFDELEKYCVALANEGGGKIILGVTDKPPRQIVGTTACDPPERTRNSLIQRLHLGITFQAIKHPDGRVLIINIPSHPIGMPIKNQNGIYYMRRGDSLVAMSQDRLKAIFAESADDFSAKICPQADLSDLDVPAIEEFRRRWISKSGNSGIGALSIEQLLRDIDAIRSGITYAALILFGTPHALTRYLSQAEVIFEYKSKEAAGPAKQRDNFRIGFFGYYEKLWSAINLRNDLQHFQDGLFVFDIPTFEERSIREAILNAVSHRNYQLPGSIFIRQFPTKMIIESPGGFPVGVTVENILDKQSPRNRCVAEIFARCGLVERSGQGMNLIFERSIQQGKSIPDFSGTDDYQVAISLNGQVQDTKFLQYLEKIGKETLQSFTTSDFLILDLVHKEEPIPTQFQRHLNRLAELGVIEKFGRGRGVRYNLSRKFYVFSGQKGIYTRKRGLDRDTNKALLMKHISDNAQFGSKLNDLREVLPFLSRGQVQWLLNELKSEEKIIFKGKTRAALWFPKIN